MTEEDIKAEIILDHYRNPRNYGKLENATSSVTEYNPICGDTIHMQILFEGETVREAKFIGRGCSISQAAASMITEMIKGKSVDYVLFMKKDDFLSTIGFNLGPAREKCALLSFNAVEKIVKGYKNEI
jgi:nitrogen fixation NifU-like protein